MTKATLTPRLAIEYLGELSTDIRAAVVLDRQGNCAAGDEFIAAHTKQLLAATPAAEIEVHAEGMAVFAARSEHGAVGVVCSRFVLPALMLYDLRMVLRDLKGDFDERED